MTENYKSGFAAIIGMANVGKSTLLNKIAGQKIAIVSPKPQTTRNKILAIHTTDKYQVVFTDTPGIHKPRTKLGEYMVKVAKESMSETDILIFVVDATRKMSEMEKEIADCGLVVFENDDHYAYLRQWPRFVAVVKAFLT